MLYVHIYLAAPVPAPQLSEQGGVVVGSWCSSRDTHFPAAVTDLDADPSSKCVPRVTGEGEWLGGSVSSTRF